MKRMAITLLLALPIIAIAPKLLAQDAAPPGSTPSAGGAPGIHMTHTPRIAPMTHMQGMHTMAATVTDADAKTGIVDVMATGMALKVHFPPATMRSLKPGDHIGLYMAYSQATPTPTPTP